MNTTEEGKDTPHNINSKEQKVKLDNAGNVLTLNMQSCDDLKYPVVQALQTFNGPNGKDINIV